MIHFYLLSVVYMLFSSLLMLLDKYRSHLSFMLHIRHKILSQRNYRTFFAFSGAVLGVCLLISPVAPGPRLVGDIFPAISCFVLAVDFLKVIGEDLINSTLYSDNEISGFVLLGVTLLHFLFPMLVLL